MVNGSIFLDTEVLRVGNSSPGGAGKMQAYNLQHTSAVTRGSISWAFMGFPLS